MVITLETITPIITMVVHTTHTIMATASRVATIKDTITQLTMAITITTTKVMLTISGGMALKTHLTTMCITHHLKELSMMFTTTQIFTIIILHTNCTSRMCSRVARIMQTRAHTIRITTTADTIPITTIITPIQHLLPIQADPVELVELVGLVGLVEQEEQEHLANRGQLESVGELVEVAL